MHAHLTCYLQIREGVVLDFSSSLLNFFSPVTQGGMAKAVGSPGEDPLAAVQENSSWFEKTDGGACQAGEEVKKEQGRRRDGEAEGDLVK